MNMTDCCESCIELEDASGNKIPYPAPKFENGGIRIWTGSGFECYPVPKLYENLTKDELLSRLLEWKQEEISVASILHIWYLNYLIGEIKDNENSGDESSERIPAATEKTRTAQNETGETFPV